MFRRFNTINAPLKPIRIESIDRYMCFCEIFFGNHQSGTAEPEAAVPNEHIGIIMIVN